MHHIYHTEGIVLSSRNFGETGKYYHIFTRELGMVVASAQGVRKLSSKLRFILQDFSYLKVDLVKGKDFWRVTSASKMSELENISKDISKLQIFFNIAKLLKRLVPGEEANPEMFDEVLRGLKMLEQSNDKEELTNFEALIVLRLLSSLGYIGSHSALENITKSPFEENLVYETKINRKKVLTEINKALRETHL